MDDFGFQFSKIDSEVSGLSQFYVDLSFSSFWRQITSLLLLTFYTSHHPKTHPLGQQSRLIVQVLTVSASEVLAVNTYVLAELLKDGTSIGIFCCC